VRGQEVGQLRRRYGPQLHLLAHDVLHDALDVQRAIRFWAHDLVDVRAGLAAGSLEEAFGAAAGDVFDADLSARFSNLVDSEEDSGTYHSVLMINWGDPRGNERLLRLGRLQHRIKLVEEVYWSNNDGLRRCVLQDAFGDVIESQDALSEISFPYHL
jgi:hypothetical protein